MLLIEIHRQVVRYLTTGRDNHAIRLLHVDDIEHALKGELVEIQAVAHIIIGRDGLGIIVDHHAAPTLLADGVQRLHATPVELYRRTDAIGT